MKVLGVAIVAAVLAGCGTINTVLRDDVVTSDNLKEARSFCGAVPRVYSGVVYDFCLLHGEPARPGRETGNGVLWYMAFDVVASGVLDTLALPYTLYRQQMDGSIEVVGRR